MKFLVVDDELQMVETTEMMIQISFEDAEIVAASNGQEALSMLAGMEEKPDVIITDNRMPIMNGLDFLRKLRADGLVNASVAVIMVTADRMDVQLEKEVRALGCGFLPKPFFLEDLCGLIKRMKGIE